MLPLLPNAIGLLGTGWGASSLFGGGKKTGGTPQEILNWWYPMAQQMGWREFIPQSQWAGQYGGTFEDWLDLQNRAGKGPLGEPAQSWQIPGTSDWLARQYMHDPLTFQLLQKGGEIAGRDYLGLARGAALQGADVQQRQLMSALAARGGGNLGAAASGGAALRGQAELGGLQAGLGMEQAAQQPLLDALTYKYNILNQIVGAKLGQTQATLGYKAAKEGAESQFWGNVIGQGLGGLGALFGAAR